VVASCPRARHCMNRCRQYHSRTSVRCSSPQVEVTVGSGRRRPTTTLVSGCRCRHRRPYRWIGGAVVEHPLWRMTGEGVEGEVAGRVAAVLVADLLD